MKVHLILAHDENKCIGINNALPWNIREELALFKHITNGQAVIMGRNTFESLPFKNGLPNRFNIVISRSAPKEKYDTSVYFVDSLNKGIKLSEIYYSDLYIIGGKSIYEMAIPFITGNIYISEIKGQHSGDTFLSEDFYKEMNNHKFIEFYKKPFEEFDFKIYKRLRDI
jgi:dihydrofolate reductase